LANSANQVRINMAGNVPRAYRMPQIRHMKELRRGGLQVANASLGIPLSAKITIRRK
jgi:hypothetical protein